MRGEHGQAAQERPRLVSNAQHEGGAHGAVRRRRTRRRRRELDPGGRHDQEARPILRDALDPIGEDLEPEPGGGARREDGRSAPLSTLHDRLARAGGVVRGQQRPGPSPQKGVRLAERLDVRVDPLDGLEPLAGQRRKAQVDRDHDLAPDLEGELEEQVVVLADRAVDQVLDGDDAGGGASGHDCLEDRAEAAHGKRRGRGAEIGVDRVLRERAWLPGEGCERRGACRVGAGAASGQGAGAGRGARRVVRLVGVHLREHTRRATYRKVDETGLALGDADARLARGDAGSGSPKAGGRPVPAPQSRRSPSDQMLA